MGEKTRITSANASASPLLKPSSVDLATDDVVDVATGLNTRYAPKLPLDQFFLRPVRPRKARAVLKKSRPKSTIKKTTSRPEIAEKSSVNQYL